MNALIGKGLIYLILAVASGFGGYILNDKMEKAVQIPACPDCNCPEPTVSIQPFDVDKIKGLRSFVYTPQFSGSIRVAGVDSTSLGRMIDASIERAMRKYMTKGRRTAQPELTPESIERITRRTKNRFTELFVEADAAFNGIE